MNWRSASLFAGLGFTAACLACHSAGKSINPADGATGSGGGGAGAFDGATADRTGETDAGAAERFSGTDASDGPVAMTATEVCRAALKAQTERASVCLGDAAEDYLQFVNLCPDFYFNADSNRTVADVGACLGLLAARTCTDIALDFYPSCFANGQRPGGAGCAYGSQCQSGVCAGTGKQCSSCFAGGASVGSPCANTFCQSGSFCHFATRTCTDASTIVYAAQGQPCDLSATPVVGCVGDLLCITTSFSSTAGTCTPAPGVGQHCASNGSSRVVCAPGATCIGADIVGGGTCALEGACGGTGLHCDAASYCKTGNGEYVCVPHATVGQPCDDLASGAMFYCLSPAYCVYSTWTCALPGTSGETCDADHICTASLSCVAGTCQPLGSTNCPAASSDGGTG